MSSTSSPPPPSATEPSVETLDPKVDPPVSPPADPQAPSRAPNDEAASPLPPEAAPRPSRPDAPRPSRPSLRPPEPTTKESLKDRLVASFFALVRDPNPILLKEFRATLRTPLFVRALYVMTAIVALFVVAIGAMSSDNEYVTPADVGQGVFQAFFTTIGFVICLFVPSYAATAITSERETRTYESLVLSDMSATRIILGKFLAYFGSSMLILVAVSPIISIAFLFGGVPPSAVVIAFFSTLVLLALVTSFGVAVSARLESTRMAILAGALSYLPSFILLGIDLGAGAAAQNQWSTSIEEGPFWFALALPELWKQPDALITLVVFPLAMAGATIWFLLASAIVGIRHAGEDKSTPLKLWAITVAPAAGIVIGGTLALLDTGSDVDAGVVTVMMASAVGTFIGFVFANEPPLPPRARTKPTTLSRLLSPVGPGAAGTTRFAMFVCVLPQLITAFIFLAKAVLSGSGNLNFTPVVAATLGGISIALFTTTIAESIRLFVGSGLIARLLTIILLALLTLVPTSVSVILETSNMSGASVPWLLSPVGLMGFAMRPTTMPGADADFLLALIGGGFYAFVGLLGWLNVELFVRRARGRDEANRASHVSGPASRQASVG